MKNVKKTLNKAFTLIELVVVMAVIAILAGVSVGVYFGVINNANQSAVDQEAASTTPTSRRSTRRRPKPGMRFCLKPLALVMKATWPVLACPKRL